jgi:putative phosphoribosyl transferase
MRFADRASAGELLGRRLVAMHLPGPHLVLALPRGGVPVGAGVASALGAPLDVLVVRKLGFPGQPELAAGAIASGGITVLNQELLDETRLAPHHLRHVLEAEQRELERRERLYRGDRPFPPMEGRTVILVDDGLATGATMRAAVDAVRTRAPGMVVVAVPVAPWDTLRRLEDSADRVVALLAPDDFMAIGQWYDRFDQVGDDEVRRHMAREPPGGPRV